MENSPTPNGTPTVRLLDKDWPVALPSFAAREELLDGVRLHADVESGARRVYAAMLGLCTPIGKAARADYLRHRCDLLAYGEEVYEYLRRQGADPVSIIRTGPVLVPLLKTGTFPAAEAAEQADFSQRPEG